MNTDITRLAMWSGPRNISTALMRSFENRTDTVVVDEPLYGFYLDRTGLDHPMRADIIASQSCDPDQVIAQLKAPLPAGKTLHYQKHMTHHLLPEIDRAVFDDFTPVFLIRDPRAMVASYNRAMDQVTAQDLGIPQMADLFNRTADRLGKAPPVLDSRTVLADPQSALMNLCAAVGIDFDPAMLAWPTGPRPTDGAWAPHWYKSVIASTGFKPSQDKAPPALTAALQKVADECMPVYEKLKAFAL